MKRTRLLPMLQVKLLAVAAAGAVTIYATMVRGKLIAVSELANVELARSVAKTLVTDIQTFVQSFKSASSEAIRRAPETEAMRGRLWGLVSSHSVLKVKIYSKEGIALFSSEPSQIGGSVSVSAVLSSVIDAGAVVSRLEYRSKFVGFNSVVKDCYVVSSYVPVATGDGVFAALEIYSDVTREAAAVDRKLWTASLTATALVLLADLFLVMPSPRRDDRGEASTPSGAAGA